MCGLPKQVLMRHVMEEFDGTGPELFSDADTRLTHETSRFLAEEA